MSDQGYVKMLRESLEKKIAILNNIESANEDQARILSDQMSTPDEFQENLEIKGRLIAEIDRIDSGFQELFNRVKEVFSTDKESYRCNAGDDTTDYRSKYPYQVAGTG